MVSNHHRVGRWPRDGILGSRCKRRHDQGSGVLPGRNRLEFSRDCAVDATPVSADEPAAERDGFLLRTGSKFGLVRPVYAGLESECRKDEIWWVTGIWNFSPSAADT